MRRLTFVAVLACLAFGTGACSTAPPDDHEFEQYEGENELPPPDPGDEPPDFADDPEFDPEFGEGEPEEECNPDYQEACLPDAPDLDCDDLPMDDIPVDGDDPHGLDADGDGIGCETW